MKEKQFDISKLKRVTKEDCFICKNQIETKGIIYQDKKVIAFLDINPPTKGYTLLALRKHKEDITELSEEEYFDMQRVLFRISKAIKKAFNPKRVVLLQTGGLVTHLHFHIIPMYQDVYSGFLDVLSKKSILELSKEEKKEIVSKIKENLESETTL